MGRVGGTHLTSIETETITTRPDSSQTTGKGYPTHLGSSTRGIQHPPNVLGLWRMPPRYQLRKARASCPLGLLDISVHAARICFRHTSHIQPLSSLGTSPSFQGLFIILATLPVPRRGLKDELRSQGTSPHISDSTVSAWHFITADHISTSASLWLSSEFSFATHAPQAFSDG